MTKELEENIIKSNDLLRSCYQVATRKGKNTNWEPLQRKIGILLDEQMKLINSFE